MKIFLIFFMFFWSGCSFSDSLFSYDFIQVSYYEVDHFSDSVVYDDGYSLDYFGGIDEDKFIYASFGVLNNHNRNMMVVISPALDSEGIPTGASDISYEYDLVEGEVRSFSLGVGYIHSISSRMEFNVSSGFNYSYFLFEDIYEDFSEEAISLTVGFRVFLDYNSRLEFSPKYISSVSNGDLNSSIKLDVLYSIRPDFYLVGGLSESMDDDFGIVSLGVRLSFKWGF